MKVHLLRRGLLLAAISAVALAAPTVAGARNGEYEEPYEGKDYCVGGETVTSESQSQNRFLRRAVLRGGYWAGPDGSPFSSQRPGQSAIEEYELTFVEVLAGACPPAGVSRPEPQPSRAGFCSVAGNTYPDGSPIQVGTFLNLVYGQDGTDVHYVGARPAIYVEGIGITCDPPPAGFSWDGTTYVDGLGQANGMPGAIYAYYKRA